MNLDLSLSEAFDIFWSDSNGWEWLSSLQQFRRGPATAQPLGTCLASSIVTTRRVENLEAPFRAHPTCESHLDSCINIALQALQACSACRSSYSAQTRPKAEVQFRCDKVCPWALPCFAQISNPKAWRSSWPQSCTTVCSPWGLWTSKISMAQWISMHHVVICFSTSKILRCLSVFDAIRCN